MATITTLGTGDSGSVSRTTINDNFTNLNTDKAELASPTFTGTPSLPTGTTAVTQTAGDNSTKVATTEYVDNVVGDTSCRVYNNTGGSLTTEITMAYDAEQFDTDSFHDNATNNSRLTIPAGLGGLYLIGCSVATGNTNNTEIRFRLNGTTVIGGGSGQGAGGASNTSTTTIYSLSAGDYIETLVESSTNTFVAGVATNFWLTKLA
jgi:hypothetical protein